jgi:hypothetical protein
LDAVFLAALPKNGDAPLGALFPLGLFEELGRRENVLLNELLGIFLFLLADMDSGRRLINVETPDFCKVPRLLDGP